MRRSKEMDRQNLLEKGRFYYFDHYLLGETAANYMPIHKGGVLHRFIYHSPIAEEHIYLLLIERNFSVKEDKILVADERLMQSSPSLTKEREYIANMLEACL
jgi:hypothetical protein